MSLSQLGHDLVVGKEPEAMGRPKTIDFCCVAEKIEDAEGSESCFVSGSPRMSSTALSVIAPFFGTGIFTEHLHTGHFPVFPAWESFAVNLWPLGHFKCKAISSLPFG